MRVWVVALALAALSFVDRAWAQEYLSGYAGFVPADAQARPRTYFDRQEVRAVLRALEPGPLPRSRVASILEGAETTLEDLTRVQLVREDEGLILIDFAYFPPADMERIHDVALRYAPSLANAYRDRQARFDRIFRRYGAKGVARADLAFVVLAGVSLNWDGLRLTSDRGWRTPRQMDGPQGRYSFWASAAVSGASYEGFYWGSSSFPSGIYNFADRPADFTFSSFGDANSDPRMNFPDLLYLPRAALSADLVSAVDRAGPRSETLMGASINDALGFSATHPVATVLFALRERDLGVAALSSRLPEAERARLPALLDVLVAARAIERRRNGRYRLIMPVLDRQDGRMLNEALSESREVLSAWLEANYEPLRMEIGSLTIERHGLSYEEGFTQIWHELFGATTREMVRAGIVSDPRREGAPSPGSLPLLWRMSLYDFTPG